MKSNLRDCPFCKSGLHISVVGNDKDYYKVRCGCCGGSTGSFTEMKPAIDYWNNAKALTVVDEIHGFFDINKANELMRQDIAKLKKEKQALIKQIGELEQTIKNLENSCQIWTQNYETAHSRLYEYINKSDSLLSVIEDAYSKMVEIDKATKEAEAE